MVGLFMMTMSKTIPTKLMKSSNNIPYLSHDLSHLIHKKHCLFKLAKRLNSDHAWLKYSKARNKLISALRAAKAQYLENLSTAIRSFRDFWVSYHKLSPKRQHTATDLKYNSHTASISIRKANLLNQFFKSCFTSSTQPLCADTNQPQASRSGTPLSNISCSQEEVLDLLYTYKLKTAAGPDGVSSRMLQETARSISSSLTELFNLSLKKAKVPDQWKISNMTPIFKSGGPSSALNYHPISLLPLISKILERIIHSRLMNYLQAVSYPAVIMDSDLVPPPKRVLLSVTNDWHLMLSKHHQVASIFFDVKKAFDSVPHDRLIKSLAHIGVCGPLLQWLTDNLQNRH